jgi:hypothetical protein
MIERLDSAQRYAAPETTDIQAQIDALIKQAGVRLRQQHRAMAVRRLAQAAHCRLASSDETDPLPRF